jgi:pimeloyl-ACP methyl ester carboxylesterase
MRADYVEIAGVTSFVMQAGSGQPVLCLHTAGQSGVQWRDVQPELARLGYRVVVPDLPGHGRSEPAPHGPIRDLGEYATWCEELIDALDLVRPLIVGCSIGGRIALDLAVRRGDRLAGVVAMACHGGRDTRHRLTLRGLERELSDASSPARSDRTYVGTLAVVGSSAATAKAELIARMHCREDPEVSTSDLIGWITQDLNDRLFKVKCPTRVAVGTDDLWVDIDDAARTANLLPDGQFTTLPGVGHYPMEEIDGFAGILDRWFTGHLDRRAVD